MKKTFEKIQQKTYKIDIIKKYLFSIVVLSMLLCTFSVSCVSAKEMEKDIEISIVNTNNILKSNKNERINIKVHNNSLQEKKCTLIMALYDNRDECVNAIRFNENLMSKESTQSTFYMKIVPGTCRIKAFVIDNLDSSKKLSNEIRLYTNDLGTTSRREKIVKVMDINEEINKKDEYIFPDTVSVLTSMGKVIKVPVIWNENGITVKPNVFIYEGKVPIVNKEVKLTLTINSQASKKDDEVVKFPDKNLESAIRLAIDKPQGDIYKGEVKNLKQLIPLDYGVMEISDLTGMENLESLEVLNIDYMTVTDLSPLRNLKNLKWLYASNNQISNLKADTFKNMKNLEQLSLEGCGVQTIEKGAFNGLTKLHYLSMGENYLTDLEEISNISTLTSLHLDNNRVNDLKPLAKLTNLQLLWMQGNGIEDISPLAKLTNLERLKLDNNNIKSLTPLESLYNLKKLHVQKNYLTNLYGIENMKNLVELFANENKLTDVKALKNLEKLDTLEIKNTGVLKDISSFSGLVNLNRLDIENNKIVDISSLKDLIKLEHIWMEGNEVEDIKALTNLVNLKTLKLKNNKIKDYSPTKEYYNKIKNKDFTL